MYQPRIRFVPECVAKGSRFALGLWGLTRVRMTLLLVSATVYSRPRTTVVRVKLPCLRGEATKTCLSRRVRRCSGVALCDIIIPRVRRNVWTPRSILYTPHSTSTFDYGSLFIFAFGFVGFSSFFCRYLQLTKWTAFLLQLILSYLCLHRTHTQYEVFQPWQVFYEVMNQVFVFAFLVEWFLRGSKISLGGSVWGFVKTPGLMGIYRLFSLQNGWEWDIF